METNNCPGTLAEGNNTYSATCLKNLFNGKKVSHIINYFSPENNEVDSSSFTENKKKISISGVQEKLSLILEKNKLRLTREGEQGTYILKPIPRDLNMVNQVPANEHLTMQLAKQVYQINTAENALIFFKDEKPAYVTKRFDVKKEGGKWGQEDFASLAGKTSENAGFNFKYEYSYEELAELMKKYVSAYPIEIEKFYRLVIFNYLFSNGDAHLKNFSLIEIETSDYVLSPAYDLINTKLHVDDSDFALSKGLFKDDFQSAEKKLNNRVGLEDFKEFGHRIGVLPNRADTILQFFSEKKPMVESLINRSFLSERMKRGYLLQYQTKRNQLAKI